MIQNKSKSYIYGFEDYNIVYLFDSYFRCNYSQGLPYSFSNIASKYIINKDLPYSVIKTVDSKYSWLKKISFDPIICEDHPQLLSTAKKVYVHSSCKLSRNMLSEKYKKSLNPYLSDAVIIPTPYYQGVSLDKYAVFINDNARIIVLVYIDEDHDDVIKRLEATEIGTSFNALITCSITQNNHMLYNEIDVMNAELMYFGEMIEIPNDQIYVMDIITNVIPKDKIVFEKSAMESLGSDSNKLDFESCKSIKDMIDSSDDNTVATGLRALSMMDWIHYPCSIRYLFGTLDSSRWRWNKACNSTSVRYMMTSLSGKTSRNRWPGDDENCIYPQDYQLYKQLKCHYDKIPEDGFLEYIRFNNFMYVTPEGRIAPRIKQVSEV